MKKAGKKLVALGLTLGIAFSMAACGGGTSENSTSSATGGSSDAGTADSEIKIGFLTNSMGTQSFNDDIWAGLERVQDELGISAEYIETPEITDAANSLRTLIAQGNNLLIVGAAEFHDAMMDVAEEYPDCKFMYLADEETGAENLFYRFRRHCGGIQQSLPLCKGPLLSSDCAGLEFSGCIYGDFILSA